MFSLFVACCCSFMNNIINNTWYYKIDCTSAGFQNEYNIDGEKIINILETCEALNINLINLQKYYYGLIDEMEYVMTFTSTSEVVETFYTKTKESISILIYNNQLLEIDYYILYLPVVEACRLTLDLINKHGSELTNLFNKMMNYIYTTMVDKTKEKEQTSEQDDKAYNKSKWTIFDNNGLMVINCEMVPERIPSDSNNDELVTIKTTECVWINNNIITQLPINILQHNFMFTSNVPQQYKHNLFDYIKENMEQTISLQEWNIINNCSNIIFYDDFDGLITYSNSQYIIQNMCYAYNDAIKDNINTYARIYLNKQTISEQNELLEEINTLLTNNDNDNKITQLNDTIMNIEPYIDIFANAIERLNMKIEELSKQEDKPSETPSQQQQTSSIEQIIKPIEVNNNHVSKLSFNIWNSILTIFVGLRR